MRVIDGVTNVFVGVRLQKQLSEPRGVFTGRKRPSGDYLVPHVLQDQLIAGNAVEAFGNDALVFFRGRAKGSPDILRG
jgi:hypothetical protein